MKKINAVLFGVGAMGKLMARYLVEKDVNILGVFSRRSHIGEDIGVVAGLDNPIAVPISSSAHDVLANKDIDIAVIATSSDMQSFYPLAESCAKHKVNVITISEQAFFPEPFVPDLAIKLDKLARENGISIAATGVQDIFWLNLPSILSGACQSIKSVLGTALVNLDMYGPAVVSRYPLDLSKEEYGTNDQSAETDEALPVFGIALEALVSNLDMVVTSRNVKHEPLYDTVDIESQSLDRIVKAGRTCGVLEIYEIETQQGISFRVEFIEKLCRKDEYEKISWDIKGVPDLNIVMENFPGEEITCATTVNRIPDVINAEAGYINTADLSRISYRASPLTL
ncbi:MAG: hypothetical protein O6928_01520 [Gammaproteobacteria bacterium]|nr:hypothetical protein [Gammaproteobacteria bacterium]